MTFTYTGDLGTNLDKVLIVIPMKSHEQTAEEACPMVTISIHGAVTCAAKSH